jgi:hypothetical protein
LQPFSTPRVQSLGWRGEFIRGFDDSRGIDTGRVLGAHQADAFKDHTHSGGATITNIPNVATPWTMISH